MVEKLTQGFISPKGVICEFTVYYDDGTASVSELKDLGLHTMSTLQFRPLGGDSKKGGVLYIAVSPAQWELALDYIQYWLQELMPILHSKGFYHDDCCKFLIAQHGEPIQYY